MSKSQKLELKNVEFLRFEFFSSTTSVLNPSLLKNLYAFYHFPQSVIFKSESNHNLEPKICC